MNNFMSVRKSARLIVLDTRNRLLLMRFEVFRDTPSSTAAKDSFWGTVGGEIEPAETVEQALVRELLEETGLTPDDAEIGRCHWFARFSMRWNGVEFPCYEEYAWARVKSPHAAIKPHRLTDLEREVVREFRWWPLDELKRTGEKFYPSRLIEMAESIIAGNLPQNALDISP